MSTIRKARSQAIKQAKAVVAAQANGGNVNKEIAALNVDLAALDGALAASNAARKEALAGAATQENG